jgi:SAM-dependent methyltransferase
VSADDVIDAPVQLSELYRGRFSDKELRDKLVLWSTLCAEVFQQYVPVDGTVVDLGAGNCEFTNAIRARRRIAVDLNPETGLFAADGVEFVQASATEMAEIDDGSVDTVFTSNFFEHLPTKTALMETMAESRRKLVEGGRLVVLMPNIRYVGGRYWDYLDHYLPLTHLSLSEGLELSGFVVERVIPRFLPYTVRESRLPVRAGLIKLYLRCRPAWRLMGGQMLVVARKK